MEKFEFTPIGYIASPFKTRFGTPRQPFQVPSGQSRLILRRDLQPELSLQGLEGFSHVWVIFIFHENTNKIFRPKVHPPRLEGKTIGAFASRTPHRPNPIGLSLARLEKIEGDTLFFSGLDLIDGTPVLDIKPYLVEVESQPLATHGWTENTTVPQLRVTFYEDFAVDIQKAVKAQGKQTDILQLKQLITEVLEKDPRPLVYKEDAYEGETHAVYLDQWNILFQITDHVVHVVKVEISQALT